MTLAGGGGATWTKDTVAQQLRALSTPVHDPDSDLVWRFRQAAAVLASFDAATIQPGGEPSPDRFAAIQELVADASPVYDTTDQVRWSLQSEMCRAALERIDPEGIRRAVTANSENRPTNTVQQMLDAYIAGFAPPLTEQDEEQLAATERVVDWLPSSYPGLPAAAELRAAIDRARLLQSFKYLSGTHFRGRVAELNMLREYVGVLPPGSLQSTAYRAVRAIFSLNERPPLLVYGPGGMGKSTLIGQFILEHVDGPNRRPFPFAYLDFDRPGLIAEEPVTLLLESVHQFGMQQPAIRDQAEKLRQDWARRLAQSSGVYTQKGASVSPSIAAVGRRFGEIGPYLDEFTGLVSAMNLPDQPVLLVLDTFEEVQYRSRDFVQNLWVVLDELQKRLPRLRTVLAGRAPIQTFKTENLLLARLDGEAARGFLEAQGVPGDVAQVVAEQVGGSPLTLKLAAEVLRIAEEVGPQGIKNLSRRKFGLIQVRENVIQGQLYTRILKYIHNVDVRKLAHPGLVLRRITAPLSSLVLAEPCELVVRDDAQAQALFEAFRREVALVSVADDGSLHHRPELREVMTALLRGSEPQKVTQIHEGAIRFYEQFDDPVSRAEEVYHRLWLGQSRELVGQRWLTGIEPHLRSAIPELPAPEQAYLGSRLGVELNDRIWLQADLVDWERGTEQRVRILLRQERLEDALRVLGERTERSAGSPLYLLEAPVLWQLDRLNKARCMQELGLESANSIGDGALSLDLLLLGAHHEARVAEFERASELLEEAAQLVAEQQPDGIRKVQIGVNRLHLDRLAGLHSSDEIDARCEGVLQAYDAIPPGRLDAYPQLLRTLTEELGYQRPELVRALLISRELSAAQAILPRFSDVIERWTRLDEGVVPLVERAARQIEGGADDATRLEACSVLLSQLATTFDVPAQVATEIVRTLRDEGQETSGLSRNVELAL